MIEEIKEETADLLEKDIVNINLVTDVGNVPKGVRRISYCIFKGIPDKTSEDELYSLILQLVPDVQVSHINLIHPVNPKMKYQNEVYCLQAFVKLKNDEHCKRVVKFFQPYNERNHGFTITNQEKISGKLFVHFCYTKPGDTFYIKKMLHVDDLSKVPKKDKKVMVYRVPVNTTKQELVDFLQEVVPNIQPIQELQIFSTITSTNAVVTMTSNVDCDKLVDYFRYFNETAAGLSFTNEAGNQSSLFAYYCYQKYDNHQKQDHSVVVYNVPADTSYADLWKCFNAILGFECDKGKIYLRKDVLKKTSTAFVTLDSNKSCDRIVEILSTDGGYTFTNSLGFTELLTADYHYIRAHDNIFDIFKASLKLQQLQLSKDKILDEIKIYNLPVDTLQEEVELFLTMISQDVSISDIKMHRNPHKSWQTALVKFDDIDDCKKVVDYFAPYIDFRCGYKFETFSGSNSNILVAHSFRSSKTETPSQNSKYPKKSPREVIGEFVKDKGFKENADVCGEQWKSLSNLSPKFSPSISIRNIPPSTETQEIITFLNLAEGVNLSVDCNVFLSKGKVKNQACLNAHILLESYETKVCIIDFFHQNSNEVVFENKLGHKHYVWMQARNDHDIHSIHSIMPNQLVMYGIPLETTKDELRDFIKELVPVGYINILYLKEKGDTSFGVLLIPPGAREKIMSCFKDGCSFQNKKELCGVLKTNYYFCSSPNQAANIVKSKFVIFGIPVSTTQSEVISYLKLLNLQVTFVEALDAKDGVTYSATVTIPSSEDVHRCIALINKSVVKLVNTMKEVCHLTADYFLDENYVLCEKAQLFLENVPKGTKQHEIRQMLVPLMSSISSAIVNVFIYDPECNSNHVGENKHTYALVTTSSAGDCEHLLSIINQLQTGFYFVNEAGNDGYLKAVICFRKQDSNHQLLLSQIVIHKLPLGTSKEELLMFIGNNVPNIPCIHSISVQDAKLQSTAFIKLRRTEAGKFYLFLRRHNLQDGFVFTNKEGLSNLVSLTFDFGENYEEIHDLDNTGDESSEQNELAKRVDEILLFNLPDATSKLDVERLLHVTIGLTAQQIRLFEPTSCRKLYLNNWPFTWYNFKAFIKFQSETERDIVYEYFKSKPFGVWLVNSCGNCSHVKAELVHEDIAKK